MIAVVSYVVVTTRFYAEMPHHDIWEEVEQSVNMIKNFKDFLGWIHRFSWKSSEQNAPDSTGEKQEFFKTDER
jgi:hypothetical protein